MKFQNQAQKTCYDRVNKTLKKQFGEQAASIDGEPGWVIQMGSALAAVSVVGQDDGGAWVLVSARVATDCALDADLVYRLLKLNAALPFGAFALDDSDNVIVRQNVWGKEIEMEQVLGAVNSVLAAADTFDDDIVRQYGGRRGVDLL